MIAVVQLALGAYELPQPGFRGRGAAGVVAPFRRLSFGDPAQKLSGERAEPLDIEVDEIPQAQVSARASIPTPSSLWVKQHRRRTARQSARAWFIGMNPQDRPEPRYRAGVEVRPASLPLDDRALQTLGVIAVQSARVEWQLAGLHAVIDTSRGHVEHVRKGRPDEHVKAIRVYFKSNKSWAGSGATAETIWWAEEAQRLLYQRGNIMHSSWVIDAEEESSAGRVTRRHMKTGEERPFDQAELDDLAYRLGLHAATGYAYMAFAMTDLFEINDSD